ncbi:hypothetical protein FB451DRAFT_1387889 [Mycena latifolia]|nr:hypothetical protein FB451DRAFT_1387889 [Mycena latifolia]
MGTPHKTEPSWASRALKGDSWCEKKKLKELTAADLKLAEEQDVDLKARHRLAKIGSAWHRHKNEPRISSKKQTFSWIWTAGGGPGEDEDAMHDSVRIDWAKALARKNRWVEEVRLLREEMRRVLRYLVWKARWWDSQRRAWGDQIPAELAAGLDAYAVRQAALHRGIATRFKVAWDTSASVVVRSAAREDALLEDKQRQSKHGDNEKGNGAPIASGCEILNTTGHSNSSAHCATDAQQPASAHTPTHPATVRATSPMPATCAPSTSGVHRAPNTRAVEPNTRPKRPDHQRRAPHPQPANGRRALHSNPRRTCSRAPTPPTQQPADGQHARRAPMPRKALPIRDVRASPALHRAPPTVTHGPSAVRGRRQPNALRDVLSRHAERGTNGARTSDGCGASGKVPRSQVGG